MKTVVFDLETSGIPAKWMNYEKDFEQFPRIVSIAWKVNDLATKHFIINQQGFSIPAEATAVHGITNEEAAASNHFLAHVLIAFIEDAKDANVVIGHNVYFDTSILKANLMRLINSGDFWPELYPQLTEILHRDKRVDTMQSTIKFCGLNGKWPKLTELHRKLFGEEFTAHSSKHDVDATHRCYVELKRLGVI